MEKSGKEFNLEDTILAAASEQGIEIPKEKEVPEKIVEVKEEAGTKGAITINK